MGDIDLVVDQECINEVQSVLSNNGWILKKKYLDHEWLYMSDNLTIELHDHLIYSESVTNFKQETFLNNFWPYVHNNCLDWNFHFLFVISHLRKHFMNAGAGFRQFMDVAILVKYANLNWAWIEEKSEEIELFSFLRIVLALCNRWFKVMAPIELPEITDEFYEIATSKIFEDGVFGFDNENNDKSYAINIYRKKGFWGQISSASRQLFPSYKNMINVPYYRFLKGKPFLIPYVWIYRFFVGRKKSKNVVRNMKKAFASKETIEKREEIYKKWGL